MKRHAGFCAVLFLVHGAFSEEPGLAVHGASWAGIGRIENSEYTEGSSTDYNDNWLQQSGVVLGLNSRINEEWTVNFGLGAAYVHLPRGSKGAANLWYPFWVAFVPELNFTYSRTAWPWEESRFNFTFGKFAYSYNHDSKNLGNYLLNGYVYPNILVSAQGSLAQAPKSPTGAMIGWGHKSFQNDLLLLTETDYAPLYDLSLADVFSFNVAPGMKLGGGINFSRFYQQAGSDCVPSELGQNSRNSKGEGCQVFVPDANGEIYVLDANGIPTDSIREKVDVPRSGIKLMGQISFDPKQWIGEGIPFGKNDLVLYSEIAILGLQDYPVYYNDIKRRIPIMVGFNFPTFGLFNLSAEVEYFASKNSSNSLNAESGATAPFIQQGVNTGRDDWKYSVNASVVLLGSVEISGMVANDHIRLGGTHNVANGLEALNTLQDWYWTTKVAYFF